MSKDLEVKLPPKIGIGISDICGLWEVIRIDMAGETSIFPWIRGRFMFNFLEDMIFACIKEGKHLNGSWKLSEKTWESKRVSSIILNEAFEYIIISIHEDEMIITDRGNRYLLARKL